MTGVEGTSSYGAGLARFLTTEAIEFREVIRPRRAQRRRGKSDPLDAYAAAEQVLADPNGLPIAKSGDGVVEQIRVLLTVRRSAIKARVAAIRQIKSLLTTAPEPLKQRWAHLPDKELLASLAATRPRAATDSVAAATARTLRRLARRHHYLGMEIAELDDDQHALVNTAAPAMIATRPSELSEQRHAHLTELLATCPELTALAELVSRFARIVTQHRGRDLDDWMASARAAALPELDPFLRGIDRDHHAVLAGLCLPYSNGPVEGVNTKTKLIKRPMYGRAGFRLLRHRILLA